jgi:hypothetical protein
LKPVKVELNSATGGAGPLPVIALGDLTQPISVVSVSIDADCLCDPSILLTFTTLISLPVAVAVTDTTSLNLQVLRTSTCCGTPISVGPVFNFASPGVPTATTAPFTFQLYDNDLKPGTYTYSVQLTTSTLAATAGVTLINSTLSALAVGDAS